MATPIARVKSNIIIDFIGIPPASLIAGSE